MKISYVKLILIREPSVSYVKYILCTLRFHMWNFEPIHFPCELGILYLKAFNFVCEMKISGKNVPIPYVFHTRNKFCKIVKRVKRLKYRLKVMVCYWIKNSKSIQILLVKKTTMLKGVQQITKHVLTDYSFQRVLNSSCHVYCFSSWHKGRKPTTPNWSNRLHATGHDVVFIESVGSQLAKIHITHMVVLMTKIFVNRVNQGRENFAKCFVTFFVAGY